MILYMNEKELNLTDLSIRCDLSYHAICNIVNGETKDIKLETLDKISKNLGIPLASLIGADKELETGQYRDVAHSVMKMLAPFAAMKGGVAV